MGSASQMAEALTKLPLVHQPGTVFEYSLSFDVLGAVVEKITGKSLGDHLAETVWKPLGMNDTTFRPSEAQRARVARPFPLNPLDGRPQSIAANGTGFFADPKEQLVVAFGTAARGELRKYYREQVQDLVYGAFMK